MSRLVRSEQSSFPCIEATYPYAIKNQRGAIKLAEKTGSVTDDQVVSSELSEPSGVAVTSSPTISVFIIQSNSAAHLVDMGPNVAQLSEVGKNPSG